MKGTTIQEQIRLPGQTGDGQIVTNKDHEFDPSVYQYEVAPVEDKAAGEHGNPSLVGNKEVDGWAIVGPDPDGHPKCRLIARLLSHPKAVRDRRDKARKDAKTEPVTDKPTLEDMLRGATVSAGKGITLGEALAQHPSQEQLDIEAAQSDRLAKDPEVQKMIRRGINLDNLEED